MDKLNATRRNQIHKNRINFALIEWRNGIPVYAVIQKYAAPQYGLTTSALARALRRKGVYKRR